MNSVEIPSTTFGHPFHARVGGPKSAPTLLLLHGHMAHAIAFRRVWARLSARFRVVALDLPGHGADQTFRAPALKPTMASLTAWLFDFLDTFAGPDTPVHLVGHSLGASLAYNAARLRPARFLTASLTSPGFCVRVPPGAALLLDVIPAALARHAMNRRGLRVIEPFRWQGAPMTSDEVDAYLEPFKDVDRLEFCLRLGADLLRSACKPDALQPLELDSQLIFGALDTVVAIDLADAVAARLESNRLHIIPDSGHSPPEDTPLRFCDVLLDFIDDLADA